MRHLICLFLVFCWLPLYSIAEVIHLDDQAFINIGKKTSILEDKGGLLSVNEVIAQDKEGKFKASTTDVLNLGNTSSAFWIKIDYTASNRNHSYLIVDVPTIEQIDYYAFNKEDGALQHVHAGSLVPPEKGVTALNYYSFNLPDHDASANVSTVYLRLKSRNIILLPIKIINSGQLLLGTPNLHMENIYIGVLISLFLFNFFLFFSLGDKTYLYYSLYVLSLFIYVVLYLRGHSYLFGYHFRIWLNLYPHIFHGFIVITSMLFSKRFLNLYVTAPYWSKIYNIIFAISILEIAISAMGFKPIASALAQYLGIVSAGVFFGAGIILWCKGLRAAKYYIYASTFMAVTVVVYTLSLGGVFSVNDLTFNLLPLGSTTELLLLAFALGDRYRDLIHSERKVKDENMQLIRDHNERLEQLVEARTIELSHSIIELENSNAVKDKLFSIIAHDLRSPFNSLVSIFTLNDMNLLTFEELKGLLNDSRKNIDEIHSTLDNLLYWARNQMDSSVIQFSSFDLNKVINDLLSVYQPLALYKSITMEVEVNGSSEVFADRNQIQLIVRNLIDNAIKFTGPGGHIRILLDEQDEKLYVSVKNPVVNLDAIDLEVLKTPELQTSTPGTANERGIGLGLQLCHEFAKANGSNLEIHLVGHEIEFYFFLKIRP